MSKLKKFIFASAIFFLVLAAAQFPCVCQDTTFNPELERHIKLGPFRLRPFFAIRDTGYDSNVYRRQTNTASDFTTTFSPGCDLFTYLGHRGKVLIKEQLDFVLFLREDSQNHINNNSLGQIDLFLKRFTVTGKGGISNVKERPNNEIDIRTRITHRNILLSTIYRHSSKTSAALSFAKHRLRYDDNDKYFGSALSDAFNRDEDSLIISLSQKLFHRTTISLESEFTDYDFQNDTLGRDAEADYYRIGFTFDPGAIISGELKIGRATFTPHNPEYSRYRGSTGEASIAYRVTPSTKMTLNYEKQISFTVYGGNLYYLQNGYGLSIFQYLTRRFGVEVGGTLYRNRYTNAETISLPGGGSFYGIRKDEIKTGFAGVRYKVNDQYNVGLKVSRWQRRSNLYTQNVDQTIIGMYVGYQF